MATNMDLVDFRFSAYRRFRRGIVSLPVLEAQLASDLEIIDGALHRGTSTGFELYFAGQLITSAKELVDETVLPLMALRQHFEADPFFADLSGMKQMAAKTLKDETLRSSILQTLDSTGGVQALLKSEHARLQRKQENYASCLALLGARSVQSTMDGIAQLRKARDEERNQPTSVVSTGLVTESLPAVIIVILIGCALLCEHD